MTPDTSLATLQHLIAAGAKGETAVQACFADAVTTLGGDITQHRYRPCDVPVLAEFAAGALLPDGERTSVVARFPGHGGGRSLILFAHPDSEPVAGLERWTHPPFAGAVANGRIHGWGVADDLAGVAIMIEAMAKLRRDDVRIAGDVILASTPSKNQARGVSALLHNGLVADAALYLHPAESGAGTRELKAVTCGHLTFRIRIEGSAPPTTEPLQTGFAHLAINPAHEALKIVTALQAFDQARAARLRHPLIDKAVGRSTNLMVSAIRSGAMDQLARVPAFCELGLALSFAPGETLEAVQRDVELALRKIVSSDPTLSRNPPVLIWDTGTSAAEVATDHPFFLAASDAVRSTTGVAPFCNPMHTGSDIRNPIVQKAIPTLGLGPLCGDLSQNGSHDEWVDVADYLSAVDATAGIIRRWCGPA